MTSKNRIKYFSTVLIFSLFSITYTNGFIDIPSEGKEVISDWDSLEDWATKIIKVKTKFYIFNITNPNALMLGEKLKFEELGPYVYDGLRVKEMFSLNNDWTELTYTQRTMYYFDENESIGSQDDMFNIPNIPFISVATRGYAEKEEGYDLNVINVLVVNLVNFGEKVVLQNITLKEILFDGWKLNGFYTMLLSEDMPPEFLPVEDIKYSLFRNQNPFVDGEFTIQVTQATPVTIKSWQSKKELEWWYPQDESTSNEAQAQTTFCNKLNGSDGSWFPLPLNENSVLRMFQSDLCRSVHLTFKESVQYGDVTALRFTFPENLLDDPNLNENNECFCPTTSHLPDRLVQECTKGVQRTSPCKHGFPLAWSHPYFLNGDDALFEGVDLYQPTDPDMFQTFVDIEPVSGKILEFSKKIQWNIELQNFARLSYFKELNFTAYTDAPSIYLPILWTDETTYDV